MTPSDAVALVDACLDDGMNIHEIVGAFRQEKYDSLLGTLDSVVWALRSSTHIKAPEVLRHIRNKITRYSSMKIAGDNTRQPCKE